MDKTTSLIFNNADEGISVDSDYSNNMQHMINRLLSSDYEFLGLIDTATGRLSAFELFKVSTDTVCHGRVYDDEILRVFRNLLPDEYYEEGIRTMARSHIIAELEKNEFYACSFPSKSVDSNRAGRKQWKFSYLDETHAQILMTRTDITGTYTAERDSLTGLYNRQGFYRHARDILDTNPNQKFVLMRCDVDRFKAYNDLYGTQAGDKLLSEFGSAIRKKTWPSLSLFAHLDADHFCALYPIEELDAETWYNMYTQWVGHLTPGYRLTTSVGLYEIVEPSIHVSLMCDRALLALRTVKDSYSQKIAWYDEDLRSRLMEEQMLIDEMEMALQEEQFVLYFQPQIDYANNTIIGAEVLVRWMHPTRGLIMPGDFIPVFEKNGFILKLDTYVWEKSCRYLHERMKLYPDDKPLPLSVNISRYDIYTPTLCDTLKGLMEKYTLPMNLLRLEITETAYMEKPNQLIVVVKKLRSLGFTLEMDDFGSGYSSLNILKDVPVDVLKLDISFLSGGEDNIRGGQILYSVIRMANWLQMPVIAEGVETAEQADYLKSLSCFYMQGYYFARPMPTEAFEEFVAQYTTGQIKHDIFENDYVANAIWDPMTQETLIFNHFIGGAAVLEYWDGNVEIIRANDQFYTEIETTRGEYLDKQRHLLDRFPDEYRQKYIDLLERALQTENTAEYDIQSRTISKTGGPLWTRNRVRVLTRFSGHTLLCLSVENITQQKEKELCQKNSDASNFFANQELRLIEKLKGVMICRYYMNIHTLERLYESPTERYGGAIIQEDVPNYTVENEIVSPDTAQVYLDLFHRMRAGVPNGGADMKLLVAGKGYRWHRSDYSLVYDREGNAVYALIMISDSTNEIERKQAVQKWRDYLATVHSEASLYVEMNLSQNVVENIEHLSSIILDSPFIKTFDDVQRFSKFGALSTDTEQEYAAFFNRRRLLGLFDEGVKSDFFDYHAHDSNESDLWMRVGVGMTKLPGDNDVSAVITVTALSEQEQTMVMLSRKISHDSLTGILNREGFLKRAGEILREFNSQKCNALLMIDLDDFKQVNDRLGHQVGDSVLHQVAQTLQSAFHRSDAVGRIGGDEFMVLLSGELTAGVIEKKAMQLLTSVKMNVGDHGQIPISVSIGIAYGWGHTSFDRLYRTADIALYSAKKAGKCRFHTINADTNAEQSFAASDIVSLQSLLDNVETSEMIIRTPFEVLVNNVPGGVIMISITDRPRLTHCNSWLRYRLGYTDKELTDIQKDDALALIHPDDIPLVKSRLHQMKNGSDNCQVSYRLRNNKGGYCHISLTCSITERNKDETIFYGVQTEVNNIMEV